MKFAATMGCLVCSVLVAQAAQAEDLDRAFRAARPAILLQMKDRNPQVRAAAVQKLREFPLAEAAKVLLLQGCTSPLSDVQQESLRTLGVISQQAEVRTFLQSELARDTKKGSLEFRTAAIACVLLGDADPAVQATAKPWLEKAAAAGSGPALLVAMVDELGAVGDAASLRALQQLDSLPLFQRQFGPRRALVQAIIQIRQPAAVTLLLEKLPALHGETRADILRHLTRLRGERLESDDQWLAWWKQQPATFEFPPAGPPAELAARKGEPTYYGLPLYGAKIVFILDTSGSMSGPRIVAAQRELVSAINALPDGVQFSVLAFNSNVTVWQSQLVDVSAASKLAATQFVLAQPVRDLTASFDALDAAFLFDAEAIYFLTDGAPTAGKIKQPQQILATLAGPNRLRRITVNAIGIGVGNKGNAFDLFLNSLAAQNFGVYQRVDQ